MLWLTVIECLLSARHHTNSFIYIISFQNFLSKRIIYHIHIPPKEKKCNGSSPWFYDDRNHCQYPTLHMLCFSLHIHTYGEVESFSLVYLNCQHHDSCALGPLPSKIKVTWIQALWCLSNGHDVKWLMSVSKYGID